MNDTRALSAAPRSTPSPLVLSLLSISAAVRDRLQPAGWLYERRDSTGGERWIERTKNPYALAGREVRVDELPGEPGGRVVEGFNGHERLVIRCVGDTDPQQVLRTLDLWRTLPGGGAA